MRRRHVAGIYRRIGKKFIHMGESLSWVRKEKTQIRGIVGRVGVFVNRRSYGTDTKRKYGAKPMKLPLSRLSGP